MRTRSLWVVAEYTGKSGALGPDCLVQILALPHTGCETLDFCSVFLSNWDILIDPPSRVVMRIK